MNFAFSEEQELLRETARRFLDDKAPSDTVRELMETDTGYDPALWSEIAQMGWQAMAIPEEYGGAGYSFLESAVLLEEMGRSLFPSPYLSTVVLAANLILWSGTEEQKAALLPAIAAGEHTVACALTEASGRWDAAGIGMPAKLDGDEWVISGTKTYVVDGHSADTLIVAARDGSDDPPEDGISLFVVPADTPGVQRRRLDTMDMTRKQAEVTFDDVRVPASAHLGPEGEAWPVIARVLDLAGVALAVEQVGGAQQCLDMSVEYAKVRVQFGRPIGSFQAIKHKCADMLVAVESAKSAAYYAAWAVSENNDEVPTVAPLAKSYCSEAYFSVAAETIQVLGGIGFTWEHDAHLYFKRAKSTELMLGDPSYQRQLLADRLGL